MIEIAIALAVIAFALVAIIGILPAGLQVQKDNLADTIINQDGAYFMEAIKGGAQGMDDLTNSVEEIRLYDNRNDQTIWTVSNNDLKNGRDIVGLLSYPVGKDDESIIAVVRAVSGSAAEKGSDPDVREMAFRYQIEIRIRNLPATPHDVYRTVEVRNALQSRLYEISMEFRWPILANGKPGNGVRVFRSFVAAPLVSFSGGPKGELHFFQP